MLVGVQDFYSLLFGQRSGDVSQPVIEKPLTGLAE
jgi:hypothetical protein